MMMAVPILTPANLVLNVRVQVQNCMDSFMERSDYCLSKDCRKEESRNKTICCLALLISLPECFVPLRLSQLLAVPSGPSSMSISLGRRHQDLCANWKKPGLNALSGYGVLYRKAFLAACGYSTLQIQSN